MAKQNIMRGELNEHESKGEHLRDKVKDGKVTDRGCGPHTLDGAWIEETTDPTTGEKRLFMVCQTLIDPGVMPISNPKSQSKVFGSGGGNVYGECRVDGRRLRYSVSCYGVPPKETARGSATRLDVASIVGG